MNIYFSKFPDRLTYSSTSAYCNLGHGAFTAFKNYNIIVWILERFGGRGRGKHSACPTTDYADSRSVAIILNIQLGSGYDEKNQQETLEERQHEVSIRQ